MFINNFKYKIAKAKIVKIIYCYERSFIDKEYDPRDMIDHPFDVVLKNPFGYYDKHDSRGDYREMIRWIYDYKILVEYVYNNKIYQNEITIKNTFRILNENKTVKIFFERKNPDNVYIKPVLEL